MITAFNTLADKPVKLEIWGALNSEKKFVQKIRNMVTNKNIEFKGRYENKDIGDVLKSFDAVLIPSIWYENSPLTIHEAYICGIPVITSNIGGMAELVPHNKSGLQFEVNNPESLKHVIESILSGEYDLVQLSKQVPEIKKVQDNAEEIEEYYFKLIKNT